MQKLLAFVDFSDVTPAVVKAANAIARSFEMKVLFLHVSTPDAAYEGSEFRADARPHSVAAEMRRIHRALSIISLGSRTLGIDAKALLVRGTSPLGNPVRKMLSEMARHKPALIVMGTFGQSRLREALLGSATTALVRKAKCPVLLVPVSASKPTWPDRTG